MKYLILKTKTAADYGFSPGTHIRVNGMTVLNEKEVMFSPVLNGTLEERAATLGADILTLPEIQSVITVSRGGGRIGYGNV